MWKYPSAKYKRKVTQFKNVFSKLVSPSWYSVTTNKTVQQHFTAFFQRQLIHNDWIQLWFSRGLVFYVLPNNTQKVFQLLHCCSQLLGKLINPRAPEFSSSLFKTNVFLKFDLGWTLRNKQIRLMSFFNKQKCNVGGAHVSICAITKCHGVGGKYN